MRVPEAEQSKKCVKKVRNVSKRSLKLELVFLWYYNSLNIREVREKMPVYTYKCEVCGNQFDQFQHFTDDPLTVCPKCHSLALHKIYQSVGIVFKGKGFYSTDNRSPSGMSPAHKVESAESGQSANNGRKSAEEKPKTEASTQAPSSGNTPPAAQPAK